MAKEDPSKEERRRAKKEKKEKRLVEEAGVQKAKKKEKDKKKKSSKTSVSDPVLEALEKDDKIASGPTVEEGLLEEEVKPTSLPRPIGALVPFANPLADEKVAKKCFRSIKKAAAHRALKRGVKEVVKSLRKSALPHPSTSLSSKTTTLVPPTNGVVDGPPGVVILAADISPLDVISHIPVLCEDHAIPYVYVASRAELGIAGGTKRPTSVVLIGREIAGGPKTLKKKRKAEGDEGGEQEAKSKGEDGTEDDWGETYRGLVKLVEREQGRVRI